MSLQALIFDVDGTLAETEDLHRRSFNETFAAHGLDWHWDPALYARLLQTTGGKERILRFVADDAPRRQAALADLPALYRTKTQRYLALLRGGALGLRPGVRRLVTEARARGLRLAIATTSNPRNVRALLEHTFGDAAATLFTVAAGDVAARKKPAPDVYFQALEALDVGPAQAVAFEDSANGLAAARAAGLAVVATPSLFLADEDLAGAASVVSDLGEPGAPLTPIAGAGFPKGYVDVDGLDALLAARGPVTA